jgi:hypothetical protein
MKDDKVKKKAKGILDGMNEDAESEEEKSKRVKEEKSKSSEVEKMKRSFMLTSKQVEKIYLLKAKNSEMTLSEIVGRAIDSYYEDAKS